MTPTFKPSEVQMWRSILPLVDTFGKAELEFAAALMVIGCVHFGDTWQPLHMKQIAEAMKPTLEAGGCLYHLRNNPFTPQPSHRGLVDKGFAVFIDDPDNNAAIEFTEKGFEVLQKTVRVP